MLLVKPSLTAYNKFSANVGHNNPTISATRSRKAPQPKTQYCFWGVLQLLHILRFSKYSKLFASTAYCSILVAFYPSTDHCSPTEMKSIIQID